MTQGGCAALLVRLLASSDDDTQRQSAIALANLALNEANREAIATGAGAVAPLIELTSRAGTSTAARAEAAAALANLAMDGAAETAGAAPSPAVRTLLFFCCMQARPR